MITRSVLDTRYVALPISATGPTGAPIDPTSDTVQLAFMPVPIGANPGTGDWHTGSWATVAPGTYQAQVLVGPNGGVALAVGFYRIWVKVTDNPEVPVIPADYLKIE